jgi:hypothetical protein
LLVHFWMDGRSGMVLTRLGRQPGALFFIHFPPSGPLPWS